MGPSGEVMLTTARLAVSATNPRAASPAGAAARSNIPGLTQAWTFPLSLLFLLWVFVLFEPDVWLASQGALWARKIPLALYLLVGALVVMRALEVPGRAWFLPFLLFIIAGSVTVPFAENSGVAGGSVWKTLLLYYCLAVDDEQDRKSTS